MLSCLIGRSHGELSRFTAHSLSLSSHEVRSDEMNNVNTAFWRQASIYNHAASVLSTVGRAVNSTSLIHGSLSFCDFFATGCVHFGGLTVIFLFFSACSCIKVFQRRTGCQ